MLQDDNAKLLIGGKEICLEPVEDYELENNTGKGLRFLDDLPQTSTFNMVPANQKGFRYLFYLLTNEKLPRKLKKKLCGTKRMRRKEIIR